MHRLVYYILVDGRGVGHYVKPFTDGRALCGKPADHLTETTSGAARVCEACEAVAADVPGFVSDAGDAVQYADVEYDYGLLPRMPRHSEPLRVEPAALEIPEAARGLRYVSDGRCVHIVNPDTRHWAYCNHHVFTADMMKDTDITPACPECVEAFNTHWDSLTPFTQIDIGSIIGYHGRRMVAMGVYNKAAELRGEQGGLYAVHFLDRAEVLLDGFTAAFIGLYTIANNPQLAQAALNTIEEAPDELR